MSHREFLSWQEWLREEWNRPNRTDHYLLRIAQTNCTADTSLDQLKITWTWSVRSDEVNSEIPSLDEQITDVWVGMAAHGHAVEKRTRRLTDAEREELRNG